MSKTQGRGGLGSRPKRPLKRKREEDDDIEELERKVADLDTSYAFDSFKTLPLSAATQTGLEACHFTTPTSIQQRTVSLALKGHDILGAAQTGSGKTLAFLIPVLENLYRAQHVGQDAGLGAMIVSPTRELAIQIFNVLRKIGQHGHMFAAGLVVGGKSPREEREALARMNIVVCTPGRMLQHLSQTAMFNIDTLRMLVLDEADRLMDSGFQREVDALIEYLPPPGVRQTLLFSATQTKKVSDLARLSLKDPEYVSVHEASTTATPPTLQQNYTITPLADKLSTLWSFLLSAKKTKLLVFLSSGKQVRHVYESFRHLQPGIPLLHLHGRQKQTARLDITERFSQARHACLFATDVAARGLDIPAVDWVVQVDCPEDADTYIHRVGRTARYNRAGRAVLFLDPAEEEGFIARLAAKKVPIERINVRSKKQKSIQQSMQGLCFKFPELKYLGQKAFVSYVRSLHVQKDREVFKDLTKYDVEGFAASMGLPGAPRIKFRRGDAEAAKKAKNASRRGMSPDADEKPDGGVGEDGPKEQKGVRTKYDRMFERRNQDVLAPHYTAMLESENIEPAVRSDGDADEKDNQPSNTLGELEDEDLFAVKSRFRPESSSRTADGNTAAGSAPALKPTSKRQQKLVRTKAGAAKLAHKLQQVDPLHPQSNRLVFDDETGEARPPQVFVEETAAEREQAERERRRLEYVDREQRALQERDVDDKAVAKEKRRLKKEKRKARERDEREEDDGGVVVTIGSGGEDDGDGEDASFNDNPPSEDDADIPEPAAAEPSEDQPRKKRKRDKQHKHRRSSKDEQTDQVDLGDLETQAMGLLA